MMTHVGEELGAEYGPGADDGPRFAWVVDPIDGTISFSRGIPLFGTIIALLEGDEAVVGLIDLPVLDERGIAAATVAAASARIGDGRSTWADGIVSRVNGCAASLGMQPGVPAREAAERVVSRPI